MSRLIRGGDWSLQNLLKTFSTFWTFWCWGGYQITTWDTFFETSEAQKNPDVGIDRLQKNGTTERGIEKYSEGKLLCLLHRRCYTSYSSFLGGKNPVNEEIT